jgi:acyl-CoA thioesterase
VNDRVTHAIDSDCMIRLFGMEVEEASQELTRVSAVVTEQCLQLHDLAHGAFMFALMDVAFALTVNANMDAVAVQWSISQFRPAKLGDKVTAECRLLHGGRRLMVVDLQVTDAQGKTLAKGQATAIPVGEAAPRPAASQPAG